MPTSSNELVRHQQDREVRDPQRRPDEPRHFAASAHEPAAGHVSHGRYAGFDTNLNPIDDDQINTHGSER